MDFRDAGEVIMYTLVTKSTFPYKGARNELKNDMTTCMNVNFLGG